MPACTAIGILRAIRKMVMELHHYGFVPAMAGIGQDFVDLGAMEKLLATPPVVADDTVYTALIWPSGSVYQSTVRTHSAAASVEA